MGVQWWPPTSVHKTTIRLLRANPTEMQEKRGQHEQTIAAAADWPAQVLLLDYLTRERATLARRYCVTIRKVLETADSIDEIQLPRKQKIWIGKILFFDLEILFLEFSKRAI